MAEATIAPIDDIHPQTGDLVHAGGVVWLFRIIVRTLFKIFFRIRVHGLTNVPDRPVIICANHLGWTDPFLILLFLPVEPRIYILGERQVAHISRFRNAVVRTLQVMVPLDRDKPREALRVMSDVLARGGSLLIFPEGKLGTEEGTLQPLQSGASHLSLHAGSPILPVGLTGTRDLWFRHTLTVQIGKPIDPAQFTGDLRTRLTTFTWHLDGEMRALLPGDTQHPRVKLLNRWLTNLF
ncbi:MAG: lysophospholipid acyltransferase family protein [Chloroflexota bacterium]